MEIDADDLAPRDAYRLLISVVIPRPIAWVSTLDAEGRGNLAPFSFFGGVTATPPTLMLSVGRRGGRRKDTARNLLETREAVVHIPHRALAEKMVATSVESAPEVNELALAGLTPMLSTEVGPPRVAEALVAMEAVVEQHIEVGDGPVDLFLMRVLRFHLADEVLADGLPDPSLVKAVGRLGGAGYCDTAEPFDIPRPPASGGTVNPSGA